MYFLSLPRASAIAFLIVIGFIVTPLHSQAQTDNTNVQAAPAKSAIAAESPFLAENNTAMDKMMAAMNVRPTGDVDADFAAMMIPHHQGAIDMALAELRYGKNEQLKRIAQEIIVDQQQEIAAMRLALGQPLPADMAAPTQVAPAPAIENHGSTAKDCMIMPQPNPAK